MRFVWNFCGSSVSIILAFILPCSFYLKIRKLGEGERKGRLGIKVWLVRIL